MNFFRVYKCGRTEYYEKCSYSKDAVVLSHQFIVEPIQNQKLLSR